MRGYALKLSFEQHSLEMALKLFTSKNGVKPKVLKERLKALPSQSYPVVTSNDEQRSRKPCIWKIYSTECPQMSTYRSQSSALSL